MKKSHPKPGPYKLPTLLGYSGHDVSKRRMPAYTFGTRLPERASLKTPGPNQYDIPQIIGGDGKTFKRAPAYSMCGRSGRKPHLSSPGPSAYSIQDFNQGARSPSYSIGMK